MKDFEVEGPDGRVYKVRAPEGTPNSEVIRLAQMQVTGAPEKASVSERFLASGVGRTLKGLKDPFDSGAQLLPRGLSTLASGFGLFPNRVSQFLDAEATKVDKDINASEKQYQAARWKDGQTGFDGARLFGNVANPATLALARVTPSGAATTIGRAFQGAVGGAAGGVLATPVTEAGDVSFGMQKLGQGAAGAVGGAVATPLVGKVADLVAPKIKALQARMSDPQVLGARASLETDAAIQQVLRDMGMDVQSVPRDTLASLRQQVLDSFKQGQRLDPAAALRKMDFEAQGVPALRGQITRDPAQYSRDMNLRGIEGVGEPVAKVLQAQNQRITADLGKFGGPAAREAFPAGEQFVASLTKLDDDLSSAVTRAYKNARSSSGKDWDVPTKGLAYDVQQVVDDFGVGGENNAIPSAVYARMQKLGIVGDDMTQRRIFNYEEADKLLKQINSHLKGSNNAGLSSLHGAVKRAILEGGGEGDPFAPARKLAAERFGLMDAAPALKAVVDGKVSADDFVKRFIIDGKVKDLRKLADLLPADDLAEAKRQIAQVIYRGAFRENVTSDKLAQPAGLQSAIRNIGTDKLKVFFSPTEIDELNRLTRITAYANTEPAWGTVARGGNPGGVLLGGMARLGMAGTAAGGQLPLLGAITKAGRQSLDATAALNTQVPKRANLTPEEIAALNGLLGITGVSAGGLLAPGP
jgi:hypothetical protein